MIHELYIGGPPTRNYSRAMLPAPLFNAAAAPFQAVKVAAHKNPTGFGLTRVLDTSNHAIGEFLRNNAVAQGDDIGAVLIPKNVIIEGFFYEVERVAGAAMVVTPTLRGVGGATLPTIDCNVLGKGYARLGAGAWQAASGALTDAGDGAAWFNADPAILNLALTTFTEMGDLRLVITPIVTTLYHGEP